MVTDIFSICMVISPSVAHERRQRNREGRETENQKKYYVLHAYSSEILLLCPMWVLEGEIGGLSNIHYSSAPRWKFNNYC